ncbi:MAG: tautomerase family protein [Brachymonas sp.]|nr:tautomerase family protein [Brachymonas sp.]
MPLTTIHTRRAYTPAQEVSIIEAVQTALLTTLTLPETDRNVMLTAHAPHQMITSPALTEPNKRTVVEIAMFPGRSLEVKRRLYRAIVAQLAQCEAAIPEDHVLISLREEPFEHWGIRGGQAACDVELGFETKLE